MQLANIKISNLLSFPYQADLSKVEGVKFYNKENNNVNVLIGPNGSGKSGFLHIIKQILKVGISNDYLYDPKLVSVPERRNQTIQVHEESLEGISKHFHYTSKDSQVIVQFMLTEHDYDNMCHISKNAEILNDIIKKFTLLDIQYPELTGDHIQEIPSSFTLECGFDFEEQKIIINEHKLSFEHKFVLLYLKTIKLLQICIDVYNDFERPETDDILLSLKNGFAFIGMNRSLKHVPNTIDPRIWNGFLGDKNSSEYHAYVGFNLCVKKIRNIISNHSTLKMNKKDIANCSEKLAQSEFYTSLVYIIKKYFNKTLKVEYTNNLLSFILIDQFGKYTDFSALSDGEQSLLSMVFVIYGYDLKDGMIFIDEPEIHFHPQMQRSFSRMIATIHKNIGTQFIVSTYSPLFINELNIGNVYRFSNIHSETKIQNAFFTLSPDEATLVHLLKFENLSKIFFVNKIIMVEGETDAYFFEFYLRYLHTLPEWKPKLTDYEIININGKGSYRVRSNFLSKFGLQSFFIGDRDNIVDYGFMTQNDLGYYYKQTRAHYSGLKKNGKTHRHYTKLVDTIRNLFPKKYRYLISNIDSLYQKNVFILKKGDIETYLGMPEKGLENMVKFCHHDFKQRLENKNADAFRQEFGEMFGVMFK